MKNSIRTRIAIAKFKKFAGFFRTNSPRDNLLWFVLGFMAIVFSYLGVTLFRIKAPDALSGIFEVYVVSAIVIVFALAWFYCMNKAKDFYAFFSVILTIGIYFNIDMLVNPSIYLMLACFTLDIATHLFEWNDERKKRNAAKSQQQNN